jgi:hypothetical protein
LLKNPAAIFIMFVHGIDSNAISNPYFLGDKDTIYLFALNDNFSDYSDLQPMLLT